MDENAIFSHFNPLWGDIDEAQEFYNVRPHLAHYTSIANVEKILQSRELWFANPLYMNDHQEVGFGIDEGRSYVKSSPEIARACSSAARHISFLQAYEEHYWRFAREHVMDTYVFCMSEHGKDDNDGLLSMWRGYGGNGSGVALVIDAGQINLSSPSSFILAKVHYGTIEKRRAWLKDKVVQFAALFAAAPPPDESLHVAAYALFERIRLFALFTKHIGFEEEREWRAVYMPNRDTDGQLRQFFGYSIGARAAEPRLRLPLRPIDGLTVSDFSLEKIVNRIILGPTSSSFLSIAGFQRMLDTTGHAALKARVRGSSIPYRHRL